MITCFVILFTCCSCPSHLHLSCNPLTGPGKWVCVESAASVDWPYFWLQAARPWSSAFPQRLSLPDLRKRHQAGQHHRPFTQRGMARTHHRGYKSQWHFYDTFIFLIIEQQLPVPPGTIISYIWRSENVSHKLNLRVSGRFAVILESFGQLLVACTAVLPPHLLSGVKGQMEYRWWSEISCS